MTLAQAVRAAARRLSASGVATPDLDARVLACAAFGLSAARLLAEGRAAAPPDAAARLDGFTQRRASGEPVARILGRREFWSLDFALAPETLSPRPETETLVEAALALAGPRDRALSILDLGTGSGCLLLALLNELPNAVGIGLDRSPAAATAARRNAVALGLDARARFVAGDWAATVAGLFDLVISNPPYIATADMAALDREVRSYDPQLALDGGPDGLAAYRAIVAELPRLLGSGGAAVLELGAGQLEAVSQIASTGGLDVIGAAPDLAGVPRALTLRASSTTSKAVW